MNSQPTTKTMSDVQAIIDRSPFLTWIDLKVHELGPDNIRAVAA